MGKNVKVSPKIKRFCREYVKDHCGAKAAIRAGYSEKTATMQASRLLTKANVQAVIRKLEDKLLSELEIDSKEILRELKKIGFSDIKDFLQFKDDSVVFNDSDIVDGTIISEVSSLTTDIKGVKKTRLKLKLHDKMKALEMLARHKNIFKEENEDLNKPIEIKIEYVESTD